MHISYSAESAPYLSHPSIEMVTRKGPKQFQGLDPNMAGPAEDFAAASAKDAVEETELDDREVDFEWVIRGFLSYHFPTKHGWKSEQDIILTVGPPIFLFRMTD